MFEDAIEQFRAAQKASPSLAMAYWGEALTRLAPTPEARASKAPTAREKAYLSAVETLFGDGPQRERQMGCRSSTTSTSS